MSRKAERRVDFLIKKLETMAKEMREKIPPTDLDMDDVLSKVKAGPTLLYAERNPDNPNDDKKGNMKASDDEDSSSGSEWSDEDELEEEEEEEEPKMCNLTELTNFLNQLHGAIVNIHRPDTQKMSPSPGLRPEVTPYAHQRHAKAAALGALQSEFRGLIIADPPGLGKTLPALEAIAETRSQGDAPCVVVAPVSCCQQWLNEVRRFYKEGTMKALLVVGPGVHPVELWQYDVIITSYSYLVAELVRRDKFVNGMKRLKRQPTNKGNFKVPKRPLLTFLSGIWQSTTKELGKFLVLDEAHTIKNPKSRAFGVVSLFRQNFQACLMLTGTPLDNTWVDCYALFAMLQGDHPIQSFKIMLNAFSAHTSRTKRQPDGKYLVRIGQMLDACTLRRPQSVISANLPQATLEVVRFRLAQYDLLNSNAAYVEFRTNIGDSKAQGTKRSSKERQQLEKRGVKNLLRAQHLANHPRLIEIMAIESKTLKNEAIMQEQPDAQVVLSNAQEKALREWRTRLVEERAWRSARVDMIVDIVNRHRDWRPDDAFVVMDESICFLDILCIAFTHMHEPVSCFRYDCRAHPAEREIALEEFRRATGVRILLASRRTGGAGLNLQVANVVIRCNVWWRKSWEDQADGCVNRPGQTKPVFIYEVRGDPGCLVEKFKAEKRDAGNAVKALIMAQVTRTDNDPVPAPRLCV